MATSSGSATSLAGRRTGILATRHNLGIALSEQPERAEEARAILQGVLTDERRVLGDDDLSTLVTRLNLVTVRCHSEQEWPQAEDDLRSLLIDVQRVLGPDDLITLMLRHNLAKVILNRGRRPEAEKLFMICWQTNDDCWVTIILLPRPRTISMTVDF